MNSIQHVAFNCKDINVQEKFYSRLFGFKRARVFNAGTPNEFRMLRLGAACLELFPAQACPASAAAGEQAIGFKHLAFEVPDIAAAVKKLESHGIKTEGIIDCSEFVPGLRVCFFKDPEGNRVELMQGWQDEKPAAANRSGL